MFPLYACTCVVPLPTSSRAPLLLSLPLLIYTDPDTVTATADVETVPLVVFLLLQRGNTCLAVC